LLEGFLMQTGSQKLLQVKDMKVHFPINLGVLGKGKKLFIKAVDGISFDLETGETLGLVGESGCGKSTTARGVLQLYRPTSGQVFFQGQDLCLEKGDTLRRRRQSMQMIFQDPYASLDPRMTVKEIIGEPMKVHGIPEKKKERLERVLDLMKLVGLNPTDVHRYPHEFSGGQRQRIGIARALAVRPEFIVCDEPVSALDVSIQAQVINLLEDLREQFNLTYLFISHDLSVVKHISHRVSVMYLGIMVELAEKNELFARPLHPYTQALLSSIPIPDPVAEGKRTSIALEGEIPSPIFPPSGCRFHPRCKRKEKICLESIPVWKEAASGHFAACHFV
jgi:oligopeptide transport system ATP-binding protein